MDQTEPCSNCGQRRSAHDAHGCCPGGHSPLCPDSGWDGTFPIPDHLRARGGA